MPEAFVAKLTVMSLVAKATDKSRVVTCNYEANPDVIASRTCGIGGEDQDWNSLYRTPCTGSLC
jgi:hypothetical protein